MNLRKGFNVGAVPHIKIYIQSSIIILNYIYLLLTHRGGGRSGPERKPDLTPPPPDFTLVHLDFVIDK
jgi:hypothetical protein